MKKVQQMCISIADYEIHYGPNEGENNITQEMRDLWDREQKVFVPILMERGYVKETDSMSIDTNSVNFALQEGISVEKGLELVHILEERYEVTSFQFEAEYDDFYDEEPFMLIFIKTK